LQKSRGNNSKTNGGEKRCNKKNINTRPPLNFRKEMEGERDTSLVSQVKKAKWFGISKNAHEWAGRMGDRHMLTQKDGLKCRGFKWERQAHQLPTRLLMGADSKTSMEKK